jgi:hypothetical protein
VKFIHDDVDYDVDDGDDAQDLILWHMLFQKCFKWEKKNYISYTKIEKKDNLFKMVIVENKIRK